MKINISLVALLVSRQNPADGASLRQHRRAASASHPKKKSNYDMEGPGGYAGFLELNDSSNYPRSDSFIHPLFSHNGENEDSPTSSNLRANAAAKEVPAFARNEHTKQEQSQEKSRSAFLSDSGANVEDSDPTKESLSDLSGKKRKILSDAFDEKEEGTICQMEEAPIRVEIKTNNSPEHISWSVTSIGSNTEKLFSAFEEFQSPNTLYATTRCIDAKKCYQFAFHVSSDDGLCCSPRMNWFKVFYNDRIVMEGSDFESKAVPVLFGNDCPSLSSSTLPEAFPAPLRLHKSDGLQTKPSTEPLPLGTRQFDSLSLSRGITPNSFKSSAMTPELKLNKPSGLLPSLPQMRSLDATCNDDEVPLRIEIYTDKYPEEIFWNLLLLDASTQPEVVALTVPNDYETGLNLYVENVCVDPLACYVYTIFSTFEDGICCNYGDGWYKVFFNDVIVAEGGEFGLSESSAGFGDGCYTASPSLSSVPTSSSNSPSTFPSLTLLPSNNPSPLPTVVPSTLPSVTPSSEPSESSVPSTSTVPSTAPTSLVDLIAIDEEYGRRYFPRRPLRPEGSFGHEPMPNCTAPSSEGRVGCVTFPKAIISSPPSWAGKILHEPSKCSLDKNLGRRNCKIGVPSTNHAISTALKARIDDNFELLYVTSDTTITSWASAAADMNGDGYVDIVLGHSDSGNSLLLNMGNGTFQDPIILPGEVTPPPLNTNSVALADMDGDGSIDIVFGNFRDAWNLLLLNNGDGTFKEPIEIGGYLARTRSIAVADFDNDGVNDVLFGNSDARNYIIRFEQGGTFVEDPIYLPGEEDDDFLNTRVITAADLNNDGFVDVIIGNWQSESNLVLLNKGDGSFKDPMVLPNTSGSLQGTYDIALADVDGDGFVDLLVGYFWTNENQLFLNRGNGQFVEGTGFRGTYTTKLAAADIDGDGSVDIVVADYYGSNLLLLNRGDGTGTFHDSIELPGGRMNTLNIAVADFDQDGTVDIFIGNVGTQKQVLKQLIPWGFNEPIALPGEATAQTRDISTADVNGDGLIDIIAINLQNSELYLNQGEGLYSEAINLVTHDDGEGRAVAVADIDNDGHVDIILGVFDGADKVLFNGGDGTFFSSIDLPNAGNATATNDIAVADLDGDGSIDIIIGNEDGSNLLFFNTGDGSFRDPIDLPGGQLRTLSIAVADVDGNGSIDIIIGNGSGNNTQLLLNEGNGTFDADPEILPGAEDRIVACIGLADFNNDGYIDILLGNSDEAAVGDKRGLLLMNEGDGSFEEYIDLELSTNVNVEALAVADVNGDDYVDILFGIDSRGPNMLFLNKGDGTFDERINVAGIQTLTNGVAIADVDGDGTLDFIFGNGLDRNYAIYYAPCSSGGAQLHAASWCFDCPSYMGAPTYADGVQKFSTCRECLPDFVQQEGAEQLCTRCAVGEERKFGHETCSSCSNGTYYDSRLVRVEGDSSNWNNDRCVKCPAGEYASTDLLALNACFKCRPGEYQPNRGSSECNICAAGSFQTESGQSSCQLCAKGGYCNAISTIGGGFRSCPSGTYNDKDGMFDRSSCIECPKGTFSIETGANSSDYCLPCKEGTFTNETGETQCHPCAEGTFQNSKNQSFCNLCEAGSYADKPGMIECIKCPHRLHSVEGSDVCPICASKFYKLNSTVDGQDVFRNPSKNCLDCPVYINTTCPSADTTIQTMRVPYGYWRATNITSKMYKCNNKACIGSNGTDTSWENPYCKKGHEGPFCQVCTDKETSHFENGECQKCPSLLRVALQTCLIVIICVLASALYKVVQSKSKFDFLHSYFSRINASSIIKILVSFYQVVSSLQVVYGVQISEELVAWFNFFDFFSLEPFAVVGLPRNCMGSMNQQLVANATWPFILVFLAACLILGRTVYQMRSLYSPVNTSDTESEHADGGHIEEFRLLIKNGVYRVISVSIVVFYFAIPIVSRGIFDAIKCKDVIEKDFGEGPFSKSYLLVDMAIECDAASDSVYRNIEVLFYFFLALWPIMIPLSFLALLIHIRDAVKRRRITPLANASRFLWNDYDQGVWFWDIIDLWRKTSLTGFIMFIDIKQGSSKVLRLIIATIVSMLYLGLLAISRPYKRQQDLYLAFIANILLASCFIAGIILQLCGQGECELVEHSLNPISASAVVIASMVGMLLIVIGFLAVFTLNAILTPTVLLTSGAKIDLDLSDKCTFHVFMSHVWATGQAKTHIITNKLKLFMPGLKVWLDVNDLEDITKLEEYVRGAEVFILFYSEGYFRSKNCRREIYMAVEEEKPIIVVHEGENSDMLKKFHAECEEFCVDAPGSIAIKNHCFRKEPIQWLDAGAFSAASLNMIYMQIFSELPHYRAHPLELSNGITVPGEQGPNNLQNHVNVLVCRGNSGAKTLAEEIKASLSLTLNKKPSFRQQLSRGSLSFRASPLVTIIDAEEYFEEEQNEEDGNEGDDSSSALLPSSNTATVLLLYLNNNFFAGNDNEMLRDMIKKFIDGKNQGNYTRVILVYEQDINEGHCRFSDFFQRVPKDLIEKPYELFGDIAIPLYSTEEFRVVSLRQIVKQFQKPKDGKKSEKN